LLSINDDLTSFPSLIQFSSLHSGLGKVASTDNAALMPPFLFVFMERTVKCCILYC